MNDHVDNLLRKVCRELAPLQVFTVNALRRVDRVPLLESQRKAIDEWLKQWTCKNNFQAIVCESADAAVACFRRELTRSVEAHGWPAETFEFVMGQMEVKIDEHGNFRFWNTEYGLTRKMSWDGIEVAPKSSATVK